MERILTVAQMREADKNTIENLCVPESVLVERAGNAVAGEIIKRFKGGRVLVCIGKGNNGADGKVVADVLTKTHGFSVSELYVEKGNFRLFDVKFDIIIDCIFGVGLNRDVEGIYKECIEKINLYGAYVISCDIPSGLNGDTGFAMGAAVKANLTVAIQEYKFGHFINDGVDYCGEVVAKDIGISVWDEDCAKKINDVDLKIYFGDRNRNVHKGNFGKVCILGGSKAFSGSVILSTNALTSLKMGVGYVNLAVCESLYNAYLGIVPECTFTTIKDAGGNMIADADGLEKLLTYNVIAVGMGMGNNEHTYMIVRYLLSHFYGTLLIDADGLNALAKFGIDILKEKKCKVILTPHVGEFARLNQIKSQLVMSDIIKLSKDFSKKYDVILTVKSAVSVITDGESVYINTSGSSGMAKGGSGDVLSGVISGLCARCGYSLETVASASYLFGKAGEFAEKQGTAYTMTASDIIAAIPKVIKSL